MSSLTAPAHVPIRSFHVPIRSGTPAGLGPRRALGAGRRALGEKATPILYVPSRADKVPLRFFKDDEKGSEISVRSFTFRRSSHAFCQGDAKRLPRFVKVPSCADKVPMRSFKDYEKGSGISIRSYTFRRSSDAFCQVYAKKVSLVLYVPIRSDKVPTRSSKFYKKGFRNSVRSFTFR